MTITLAFVLTIHGLLHLIGFSDVLKGKYRRKNGRQESAIMGLGILWLVSCIIFLFTAFLLMFNDESWWMVGLGGIISSQLLIITFWKESKWGTAVNLFIFVAIAFSYGEWKIGKIIKDELPFFLIPVQVSVPSQTTLPAKPLLLQAWLKRCHALQAPAPSTAHLFQKGSMRLSSEDSWIPFMAEQYSSIGTPAFFWMADVKGKGFKKFRGMDQFRSGKGHMSIYWLSLIPIVDKQGAQIDQGSALRYLAEMVWYPSAMYNSNIAWSQLDDTHLKATLTIAGQQVSGVYTFNREGDMIHFEALRYYDRSGGATLEKWLVDIDPLSYKEYQGIRIPAKCSVSWELKEGIFNWYRVEIIDARYTK